MDGRRVFAGAGGPYRKFPGRTLTEKFQADVTWNFFFAIRIPIENYLRINRTFHKIF